MSNALPVNTGVPQGSILCPVLFIIFINNMCNVIKFTMKARLCFMSCTLVGLRSASLALFAKTHMTPFLILQMEMGLCNFVTNKLRDITRLSISANGNQKIQQILCHSLRKEEFAICQVVRHGNVNSIQNYSTVTYPTMEPFCIFPPITLPCCTTRQMANSQISLVTSSWTMTKFSLPTFFKTFNIGTRSFSYRPQKYKVPIWCIHRGMLQYWL